MTDNDGGPERYDAQRRRTMRALDVLAVRKLSNSSKEDPVATVPIKFICEQADTIYATLNHNSFFWHVHNYRGAKYLANKGKFQLKCKTFLDERKKLDRLDKIRENPKDHIFEKGGVSK